MKHSVKIATIILAAMMLLGLISCSNNPGETENTTAAIVSSAGQDETTLPEETKLTAKLPDVKYNRDFNIASGYVTDTKYTSTLIVSSEVTGDLINDAVYARTVTMEEQFGVKINVLDVTYTQVINSYKGGDRPYDIGSATLSEMINVLTAGVAVNLKDVSTIDLSMPWWDQNANDKFMVKDKLYYTFSDFFITGIDNTRACFFNKDLIKDLSLTDPYTLVEPGKWTVDTMREMCVAALSDLDGDGKITTSDRVGVAEANTQFYEAVITSCDMEPVKQGADHIPYYPGQDDTERFTEVYTHLLDLFSKDNAYLNCGNTDAVNMFARGDSLFILYTFSQCPKFRQTSDVNFGILPCPKYNEDQERYLNVSPNGDALYIIAGSDDEVSFSGVMCEAASYYSSSYYSDKALMPSYFDLCLASKNAPDLDSSQNLQLIHDNIAYTCKVLTTGYMQGIYNAFGDNNYNISSTLKTLNKLYGNKIASELAKIGVEIDG